MSRRLAPAAFVLALLLGACGGNESISSTTPRPDTSAAEVSFGEPDTLAAPGSEPGPEAEVVVEVPVGDDGSATGRPGRRPRAR